MSPWGDPPRWLIWLCAAVIVAGAALTVAGAFRIGITVDETFHVVRLRNYFDHGWYLLDDDLGPSGPGAWVTDSYVYAPVTALFLHLLNVVVGNEAWSGVSTSADAYVVRHLGVALLAAWTVASVAVATRLVSGSWRWGVVASAVLVALPMWSGHAMFNVKDVPVAAGYTFATLGCMVLVTLDRSARRRRAVAVLLLFVGVVLAVGTRPAIWPGLAAAIGLVAVASLPRPGRAGQVWRIADLAVGSIAGLAVLAVIYPSVYTHPVRWALGAASESAGYQGERFWAYIPVMVMCTVPVVLLVFGVVGSVARFRRRVAGRDTTPLGHRDVMMALVVSQALLLPVILMIRVPSLNGGLRHLLFAAPAVAILMASGIAQVRGDMSSKRARTVVAAVAAAGMAVPLATQVQLFPLAYSYGNPLSDAAGLDVPADFWQASFREYADVIPSGAHVVCGAEKRDGHLLRQMPFGGQSWLALSQDCATVGALSVLQPYLEPTGARGGAVGPDFVALIWRGDAPDDCTEIGRVTRRRLATEVVASRALLCPLVLSDYEGPIAVDGAGNGARYLLGGWTADGGDPDITVEDRASLGFRTEGVDGVARLRVRGTADGNVDFLVNNVPARVQDSSGSWLVRPAAPLPELGEPGNLVLTMVVTGGRARVSHVEVEEVVG
ncbi:membrane hypothetical protein [metagenome]|uniref:Glycosyltransferase RgtA/B/C/D-like domain-containing protein n=1 Tax=metagenome TaxID=256318 RepID=A0A2P2CDP7_9ZZZZ